MESHKEHDVKHYPATNHKRASSIPDGIWLLDVPLQTISSKITNWKQTSRVVLLKSAVLTEKGDFKSVYRLRYFTPYKWYLFFVLLTISIVQTTCQNCDIPETVFNVLETDPAGTELFSFSSYNRTNVYSYTTSLGWLSAFLNLTLNETDLFYYMRLTQPLDLEDIYYNLNVTDTSAFTFTLQCTSQIQRSEKCLIIVEAVNEYSPRFNTSSIVLSVKETLPKNSILINLTNWASDEDINQIGRDIAGYSFIPYTGDPQVDGNAWLLMLNTYDGIVVLKKDLDYESLPPTKKFILLGVNVTDIGGKSGTASLTVFVQDDDDLPPMFTYLGCGSPCYVTYMATVSPNVTGPVTDVQPAPIYAVDGDTLNYQIEYHIVQGPEHFEQYISINYTTGNITILHELRASGLTSLVLIVEAREISLQARSTRTTLLIRVYEETKEEEVVTSSGNNDDDTIIAVATVLAAIVVVVVVLLVITMIYFKKRYKKTVHPESSITSLHGGLHVLNGKDEQKLDSTKADEKSLVSGNDSEENMSNNSHGDVNVTAPKATALQRTFQMLNSKESKEPILFDNHNFHESQISEPITDDDEDDSTENIVSTSDTLSATSAGELEMNSSDQDVGSSRAPPRPTLTILSGLKFADDSNNVHHHYDAIDKNSKDTTSKSDISDADHSTISSLGSISPSTETYLTAKPAPLRKRRPRRRAKTPKGPEVNVYDGTVDTENVELDSGFYTDTTKRRIKRTSRIPVVVTDPNDTRYWITVNDNE